MTWKSTMFFAYECSRFRSYGVSAWYISGAVSGAVLAVPSAAESGADLERSKSPKARVGSKWRKLYPRRDRNRRWKSFQYTVHHAGDARAPSRGFSMIQVCSPVKSLAVWRR